ncbi:MAG: hypothetical protein H6Q89_1678 [Myxococcaceae bacterium]|nr:hypothetical protein [Myxococcaceae bacterium]
MNKGITLVAAVCFGAAFGACVRNVVSEARAQPVGQRLEYKVLGASMGGGGYEEDLNKMAAEGWRYNGPIPLGNANSLLVFERSR